MEFNVELRRCPFCNSDNVHTVVEDGVRVQCLDCGCRTMSLRDGIFDHKIGGNAIKSVVEKWNKRS